MPKKVLLLYTSVGMGHKSIAENMGLYLEQAGYEVKLHDVLLLQAGPLVSVSTSLHQFINRSTPWVWKWLYTHANQGWFASLTLPNRVRVASRNYQQVKKVVDDYQPDLIIATQTNASAIVQYLKQQGWYNNLFAIAFSDYHLHRYWLYEAADFYLVNIEEQKQEMVKLGIAADKIYVLGVTLPPKPSIDGNRVRQKLGIKAGEKVVLLASGSLGTVLSIKWMEELARRVTHDLGARLVIVCGKNQQLYRQLTEQLPKEVIVLGYYQPFAELYAISDIFLTKPGGLMVAEALQWHLPMLITHLLPGQEGVNFDYLRAKELVMPALVSVEPSQLFPVIGQELTSHGFRQSLISNPFLLDLTQAGTEGQGLVIAVKREFHEV